MSKPRALIIGGSVGGLLACALFRQRGWDATIFERARGDLSGRGAGLGISGDLVDIMLGVGARFDASTGSAHASYDWMRRDGTIAFTDARPTVGSTWPRIYRPLRDVVPESAYRQDMSLVRVEQDDAGVAAVFADGTRETGDLLIAADGVYSTTRRQFLPEVEPVYANYVAWRGIVEESEVSEAALRAIEHKLVYCFPEGEMLLAMTVPGAGEDTRFGHRRVYFIWYRPAGPEALADLCTDAVGKNHGASIPPPLIRRAFIDELKSAARETMPACVAEIVERAQQPLLQAVSDLRTTKMVFGRVALMGDAAFIARPHTAAGVSKAALDAKALIDELSATPGDMAGALARYEAARMDFGRKLCDHSRWLGAFLEAGGDAVRDPREIIRQYGAQTLLRPVDVEALQAPAEAR